MPEQAQRLKELSDELGSLFDTYEKSSPPHDELEQVQKATQGLMEEVNYFLNVSENVSESADHHIEEKIVKTVIGVVLKDLVPKVEVALKRELDKLANILVDEVRPVLENDPESSGSVDQAVLEMRSDIGAISKEIYQGAAATVEHALNVAMNNVVRQKALAGYLSMVRVATEAAGSKLETRVKSVVTELETIVGTPTSKDASVPSQHAGAPGSHSGHNVGVSHSPAPQPRPVHPAVTPVQDAGVSRSPPPPPGPAHPPVSAKTGHDELSDDNPPTSPNRAISDRSGALMADLNRILAGPPKVPGRRGTIQSNLSEHEEYVHETEDHQTEPELKSPVSPSSPRELAPIPEPQTLDASGLDAPPPNSLSTESAAQKDLSGSVHSLSTSADSGKALSAETGKATLTLAESGKVAKGSDAKDGKEKEKKKFGLKSMLTHMTKGRPKASKKKGSGPHDDEADAEGSNDQLAEHEESSPLDIPATQSPTIIHTETHHAQSPLPPARRSVVSVDVAEKDQFGGDSTDHPSVGYSKQESDAHVGAPGPAPPVKPRKPPPSSPVSSYSIDSSECRRISEEPAAAEHGVVQRKSVAIPDDKAAPGSVSPPLPPSRRPPVPTPSPARKSQVIVDEGSNEFGATNHPMPPAASPTRPPPRPARPAPSIGDRTSRPISEVDRTSQIYSEASESNRLSRALSDTGASDVVDVSADTTSSERSAVSPVAPSKQPKRIPGVYGGHGAISALAAAVTGRTGPPVRPPRPTYVPGQETEGESEQHAEETKSPVKRPPPPVPMKRTNTQQETTGETEDHHEHVEEEAHRSTPPIRAPPPMELLKEPLNIKKKADSTSGDDKLIEKLALDWLNTHLAKKEIVVENLYNSLGDGLNLIYSLEACTGESVGKYNKRSMLPVHRIDNIAVALSFLQKREVATGFLTPQDVINQDRGKILTLFNYILKKYPL